MRFRYFLLILNLEKWGRGDFKIIENETEINHFAFLGFCGIYGHGPKNHSG